MATHWETGCHQGARSRSFPTFSVKEILNRNIEAQSHLVVTKVGLLDVAVVTFKPPRFLFSRNTPPSLLPFLGVILEGGLDRIWKFKECFDLFVGVSQPLLNETRGASYLVKCFLHQRNGDRMIYELCKSISV